MLTKTVAYGGHRKAAQHKAFRVVSQKLTFLTVFRGVNMKSRKHLGGGCWRRSICYL